MDKIKITDVRVNPGDSAFLIDDGKTAIMYDSGFAFTGYGVADKIKKICFLLKKIIVNTALISSNIELKLFWGWKGW